MHTSWKSVEVTDVSGRSQRGDIVFPDGRVPDSPWRRLLRSQDMCKRPEVTGGACRWAGQGCQTETEWPKAETGSCGVWVGNRESNFWTVC